MKRVLHLFTYSARNTVRIKFFCLIGAICFFTSNNVFAQPLTGVKYITSYNSHPADYATVALAITDLNSKGVGAGGVTFMIPYGYTETLVAVGAGTITATGTLANQVAFRKDNWGSGGINPIITAFQLTAAGTTDAIITISGGDYITFDGIDLKENSSNTVTSTGSSNRMTEYGYYLLNSGSSNGVQNDSIKNCTITLNTTNGNSTSGIFQFGNGTAAGGDNSNNVYYNVSVTNASKFIWLKGSSNLNAIDNNCKIQNCTVGTGSTLTVGTAFSSGDSTFGIGMHNQKAITVSGNTIQNIISQNTNLAYGCAFYAVSGSATSFFYNNTIKSINNNRASSSAFLFGLYVSIGDQHNLSIYNTIVKNISCTNGAGDVYGIYFLGGTNNTSAIYNSSVQSVSSTAANNIAGIYFSAPAAGNTASLYNDTVSAITDSKSSATITYGIFANGPSITTLNNCIVNNVTSFADAQSGIAVVTGGTSAIYQNRVYTIRSSKTSSTPVVDGLHISGTAGATINVYNNFISAIRKEPSGATSSVKTAGLYITSTSGTPTINIYYNSVYLSDTSKSHQADFYTTGSVSLNIKNNIFKFSGQQNSNKAYCVYFNSGTSVISSEDYNDYDMGFINTTLYFTGYNGTDITTLANWKVVPNDQNSKQFSAYFTSFTDLHLATIPTNPYDAISLSGYTTDIDGDTRGTGAPGNTIAPYAPIIGADEVSRTTLAVVIQTNHPDDQNISKGTFSNIIGSYILTAFNADGTFQDISVKLNSVSPLQYSAGTSQFLNFKLWINTSYSLSGATPLSSTVGSAVAPGSNLTFPAFSYDLTSGVTYYLFVTADVSPTASPDGTNIYIDNGTVGDFTFAPGVNKYGSTTLAAGGVQTICTFFYNTAMLDSYDAGIPGANTTNIDSLNAWRPKKTDDGLGMGGPPTNFTNNYQVFNVIANGATFATTPWTISGYHSRLQIGDGVNPITLTVPAGIVTNDTVDVLDNGYLKLQNAFPAPATMVLENLTTNSTVDFASSGAVTQNIPAANYGKLISSSNAPRILASSGTIGIANTFTPGTSNTYTNIGSTINFNGTTLAQSIPIFTYNNLTVNNTSGLGATSLLGSIVANGAVTVTTDMTIPSVDTLTLITAGASTPSLTANSTGVMNVNGTLYNLVSGQLFNTTALTAKFNSGSLYENAAVVTTQDIQIPTGTWATTSTCKLSGIVGTYSTIPDDYTGLNNGHGNAQAFGNFVVDCPNLVGKILLCDNTTGGFSANVFKVNNTGSAVAGTKTGLVQIARQSTQETVNIGTYIQESGFASIADQISGGGTRSLIVAGNFTVNDSLPALYHSKFEIISAKNNSAISGFLTVAGNLYMAPGSILYKDTVTGRKTVGYLNFNGASGNQNATFSTIVGDVNFQTNKSQVSGGNDTVKLLTNATADSFLLNKGVFSIGNNTLTINSGVTYPNPSTGAYDGTGTGTFAGSTTSYLNIGSSGYTTAAGTLKFATNTAASPYNNYIRNLTLYNGATATTGNALNIAAGTAATPGIVSVHGSGVLTAGGFLTIKSDANGTARVDSNTVNTNYISGNVGIERYIQGFRAWRLLTAPITSTQTINASWQEGQYNSLSTPPLSNTNQGYGTQITNTIATSPSGTGFDQAVTNNPSILFLNGSSWVAPSSTTGTSSTNGNVSGQPGYMLFVRGDRSVQVTTPPFKPAVQTTLRTKGTLNEGDKIVSSAIGFGVVGNPYASEISLDNIFATYKPSVVGGAYYAWDPTLSIGLGVGAFVTAVYNSPGNYSYTSLPSSSLLVPGKIESGAAFLFNFVGTGNAKIQEKDKTVTSALVFRPVDNSADVSFRGDLYAVNTDGSADLEDGTLTLYSNQYSDSVSWLEDAKKIGNPSENIALKRDNNLLAIEKRQPINVTDTIFFSITNMRQQQPYQFRFAPAHLAQPNLIARLEDKFLNTSTQVSLADTTKINFSVTSNSASQGANRFRIVFLTVDAGPLPVTFTSVKAWQQNADIAVEWKVTNELNIKQYEVEKSTDGRSFEKVATVKAVGNNAFSNAYSWPDANPAFGNNYYRIRSIAVNGAITYTEVVRVKIGSAKPEMIVYPNPVKDGIINLQFTNIAGGFYTIELTNHQGQVLLSRSIQHVEGSATETLQLGKTAAKGIYTLEVTDPRNNKTTFKILTQ